MFRRDFLRQTTGLASTLLPGAVPSLAAQNTPASHAHPPVMFDVRQFGAVGDGASMDTPAVNRAIEAASAVGEGTVVFPAGQYLCYTIRLRSHVALRLEAGATIVAAEVPKEGTTTGGYDSAGPPQPWEAFQDYGHNHWPNSLIYGEGLENIAIYGPGMIWGKGLSRGEGTEPRAESPGVANKSIALKNCRNVVLRDFAILMGGHFAVLLTGTDNVVIDGLTIDTNRDGIDIDCCRNVRVENCVVNSPWDDAICPKSSFALGYPRSTENVTISNCYVTVLRGVIHSPLLLRLGARMRGPRDTKVGVLRRVLFSNIVSSGAVAQYPSIIAGIPGALVEDIKLDNIYLQQLGGGPSAWATLQPPEEPAGYPEADMFGTLPATGFFLRHARNLEFSNVEIAVTQPDARPAIWAEDVHGLDVFRLRVPRGTAGYALNNVQDFRSFGSRDLPDRTEATIGKLTF